MMKQEIVIEQKWVTISEFNKVRAGHQQDAAFVRLPPQAPHIAAPYAGRHRGCCFTAAPPMWPVT